MSHLSRIEAAPRWRHFIPVAEGFSVKVPAFRTVKNAAGQAVVVEKVRIEYVSPGVEAEGNTIYPLPGSAVPKNVDAINISYNASVQDNAQVILYYDEFEQPVFGNRTFTYDAETNSIVYQRVDKEGFMTNRAPVAGTTVVVEATVERDKKQLYVRIPLKKAWLIQGARPLNASLVNPTGMGQNQFQGGYRCTLKLVTRAAHGHARITDDKLAFEYKPDMGFEGDDSFAFRLVNHMGQESIAYCIHVTAGNKKPTTGA